MFLTRTIKCFAVSPAALSVSLWGATYNFTPDYRFNAVFVCLLIEINCSEHITVIGNGYCRHFIFTCFFEKVFQPDHSVEKTIVSMEMKMDKVRVFHNYNNIYKSKPLPFPVALSASLTYWSTPRYLSLPQRYYL